MHETIENTIRTNLPEERTQDNLPFENSPEIYGNQRIKAYKNGFNQALSQINTSLIADEVLKITKCNCCDEEDEHIFKDDRSTTRISRPCSGCGKHQTIAGALLKSKEWEKWYKYASENMLFDVDETLTIDAMSDEHWNSFMKFLADEVLKVVVESMQKYKKSWNKDICGACGHKIYSNHNLTCDCLCKVYREVLEDLLSNLSPNKENEFNITELVSSATSGTEYKTDSAGIKQ